MCETISMIYSGLQLVSERMVTFLIVLVFQVDFSFVVDNLITKTKLWSPVADLSNDIDFLANHLQEQILTLLQILGDFPALLKSLLFFSTCHRVTYFPGSVITFIFI